MGWMASQITNLIIVYSTVYSGADQRKHQSSAPLVFVKGIHGRPVNSPHKRPVARKMFPFDGVIMKPLCAAGFIQINGWHWDESHVTVMKYLKTMSTYLLLCSGAFFDKLRNQLNVRPVYCIDYSLRQRMRMNSSGMILFLRPANERRCHFVTTSLIGWAQA